jgi:hypothetical protein
VAAVLLWSAALLVVFVTTGRHRSADQKWIYPPPDDPDAILRTAGHRFSRREAGNVRA